MFSIQRAKMGKRFVAFLFDAILFACLAVGFIWIISLICGYDGYVDKMDGYYKDYGEKYHINLNITAKEYSELSQEDVARYEEAIKAFSADKAVAHLWSTILSMTVTMTSIGILLAFILWEFIIPLWLRNGQTLGKKVFGIALVRVDGVRITPLQLFVRTILGKFTVETMVPVLITILIFFNILGLAGTVVVLGLLALQLILVVATRNHTPIHDLFAATVAVDFATQLIFDTPEDRIAYKEKEAALDAERSDD